MNTPPENPNRLPKLVVVLLWVLTFAAAVAAALLLGVVLLTALLRWKIVYDLHPLLLTYIVILLAPLLVFFGLRGAALWRDGFRRLPKPQARRVYWGTAIAFTSLLVFCYSAESWRGRRAYAKFMREVESRGVRLDLQQLIPPAVPDEENFCATPLLAAMAIHDTPMAFGVIDTRSRDQTAEERLRAFDLIWRGGPKERDRRPWTRADFISLAEWEGRFAANSNPPPAVEAESPAAAVLFALQRYDPDLNELCAANLRPHARWLVRYELGWLGAGTLGLRNQAPRSIVCTLNLRAAAELELYRSDAALADIKLALRLADSFQPEPLSHKSRLNMITLTLQPVWEGLVARRWSEAQLTELQMRLEQFDLEADYLRAMRGEEMLWLDFLQRIKTMASLKTVLWNHANLSPQVRLFWGVLWAVIPSGWYYDDMAYMGRVYEHMLARPSPLDVSPSSEREDEKRPALPVDPFGLALAVPKAVETMESAGRSFASINLAIQQARLACALERYRQAQAEFPENLSVLVPRFIAKLPTLGTTQKPLLGYRRTTSSSFILFPADMRDVSEVWKRDQSQTGYYFGIDQWDGVWRYPAK